MINIVTLVGRISEISKLEEKDNQKVLNITLEIPRTIKADGIYKTDKIPSKLFDKVAEKTLEYCKKGNIVGLKGTLQIIDKELTVITERITFLTDKMIDKE